HAGPDAAPRDVGPVRVAAAEPEAEGLALGHALEEGLEVLVRRPGGVARPAAAREDARPPALAGQADVVARGLEEVGVGVELLAQDAVQVAALLQPVARLAGQDGRPRRRAGGRDAEGPAEE